MREDERIARLARIFGPVIGDDAAVLEGGVVWTIDEQVERVHFRRELLSFEDLGWRSLMTAASDVAAMGADPWCALAALVLTSDVTDEDLDAIARGQQQAAHAIGAPIVGGNLSRGDAISIATTVLGKTTSPILRSGARAGDGVWLAGKIGLAAAGLLALKNGVSASAAISAWRRPVALIAAGRAMRARASASIDVSDGLALDASRLARASSVQLRLEKDALIGLCEGAVESAIEGGEDYALLCTSAAPIEGFVRVGEVGAGEGVLLDGVRLAPRGWDHFA